MSARANVVLPAPRSPESVMTSPGSSAVAMSTISRMVACSSGRTAEKLVMPDRVSGIATALALRAAMAIASRRGPLAGMAEREHAGDRGAAADGGVEGHRAAVQLDEGAHERKSEAGAAVMRAQGICLEPIEHPVLHVRRDAGALVRNREHQGVLQPLGRQRNGLARRRKAYGVGQKIEQGLTHPGLVGDEAADIRGGAEIELDLFLPQPVLNALGRRFHGHANLDLAEIELHRAGVDGGEIEDIVDD